LTNLASRRLGECRARKVLVVDDHRAFTEALACRLDAEPGITAAAATTIEQARWLLAESPVDVVLIDVNLDGHDGIRFADEVLSEHPGVRVVVVTAGEDEARVVEAARIGVSAWVPKDEPVEQLLAVMHGALRGETWIPPRLLTRVLAELTATHRTRAEHEQIVATLTKRENEVLRCLASGMNRDAIASELCLSGNTVRTHIQNLMAKLDVHSTLAAVALARRAGLTGGTGPAG
jgi:DNA-binding NarL/FixJ family response regulator